MFWALTLNTLRLLWRQKFSLPLFLLLAAGLPGVSYFVFSGDGTLNGVLKMMWGWQFYAVSVPLMLVTIYLAAVALDSELKGMQILTTAVKPAPRWMILLSKFTAVCLLSGFGVAAAGVSSYAALRGRTAPECVRVIRQADPEAARFSPEEREKDVAAQRDAATREFFTSRITRRPQTPDFLREIREQFAKLKPEDVPGGKLPTEREMADLAQRIAQRQSFTIPFSAAREFVFTDLPVTKAPLTFRYKIDGSYREGTLGWLQAVWQFSGAAGRPPFTRESTFRRGTEQSFLIPGESVGADGRLRVMLGNISAATEKSQPANLEVPFDGLRLMLPHGSFAGNFARAWMLLWFRLCLLAAIGVGGSAIVGAPVNGFLLVSVLLIGAFTDSICTQLAPPFDKYRPVVDSPLNTAKRITARALSLLPDFTETDPVDAVNNGEEISMGDLGAQFARDVLLRGGLMLLLGAYALKKREIAVYRG